jgi:hypothetical protein
MDTNGFYDYLAPYGVWVHYAPYGYVWTPRQVRHNWRPYTHGRWAWTNYGWTWISYYEWGWVPFHYGRWGWDTRLGWFWVPGNIWSPAWVSWRWSNLYIGWCPLPPDIEFVPSAGIGPLPDDFPDFYWVFIEGRYFQYDSLDRYVLPFERNRTIARLTIHKANLTVRNRQLLNNGVDVDQVARLTRSEISRYELEEGEKPGPSQVSGNTVRIFRPAVRKVETAKPKVFLEKDEAEKQIPEIRAEELEKKGPPEEAEKRLRDDHEQEMRLLNESQEEEKLAGTTVEKEKVRKEAKVKSSELKKAHDEEKAKIAERHQQEEKVVKGRIKKKDKD